MRYKLLGLLLITALFGLSGCDVDQTEEGELPDVDVEGGNMPEFDVEGPDVSVESEKETIEVPDIDVETKEKTVEVPDVDVDIPEE